MFCLLRAASMRVRRAREPHGPHQCLRALEIARLAISGHGPIEPGNSRRELFVFPEHARAAARRAIGSLLALALPEHHVFLELPA